MQWPISTQPTSQLLDPVGHATADPWPISPNPSPTPPIPPPYRKTKPGKGVTVGLREAMLAAEQWPTPAEDDGDGRGEEALVVGNGGGDTTVGKTGGDRKEESAEREQGKGAEIVGSTTTEREWWRGSNDGWSVMEAEEEEGGEGGGVTVAAVTKNREEKAGDGGEVKRKGEGMEVRQGRSVAFGGQKGEAEKGQGRRTVERGTIGDGNGRKKMEEQQRRVTMVEAMAVTTNDAGDDHGDEKRRKGRGGRGRTRRGKKALGG